MERAIKFLRSRILAIVRTPSDGVRSACYGFRRYRMDRFSRTLIYHAEAYKPSMEGTLIYFTAPSGDLSNELIWVEPTWGKVLVPRTQISEEHGYMAAIRDTEGNRIALHSRAKGKDGALLWGECFFFNSISSRTRTNLWFIYLR